jgi:hypothetical protein
VTWVPTLADAERWVREKEAREKFYEAAVKTRALLHQKWLESPEYKKLSRRQKREARQYNIRMTREAEAKAKREAELKAQREAERARRRKADAERVIKAAERAAREPRCRRSRIDWSELIDNPVTVERQIQWERHTTALAMRAAGLTYREIGERMGISRTRAAQMVDRASRRKPNAVSPGEAFMNAELHKEVADLATAKPPKPFRHSVSSEWVLMAGSGG